MELYIAPGEKIVAPSSDNVGAQIRSRPVPWFSQICHALVVAALAVGSYLVISHYFLQTVEVQGVSMLPTLRNADHYFLNRWILHMHSPHRGDIVVLKDPTDGVIAVKRIIAMPGETVHLNEGKVNVNGRPLDEPYLAPRMSTFTGRRIHEEKFTCGPEQFFVMGDNRWQSLDSRVYGPVPRANLLGLVIR